MKSRGLDRLWSVGGIVCLLISSCGGGGYESPMAVSAAPVTAPARTVATGNVDLANAETAVKVVAALIGVTEMNGNFSRRAWHPASYEGDSRTIAAGCFSEILNNPDSIVSGGDSIALLWAGCETIAPQVAITRSLEGSRLLEVITTAAVSQFSEWSARESLQQNMSARWSVDASSNSYKFEGIGDSTYSFAVDVNHAADGTQIEIWSMRGLARGKENGLGFEYVADGRFTCTFSALASTAQTNICSVERASLKGQIGGRLVDAVLSQPKDSSRSAALTFQIEQAGQKVNFVWRRDATAPTVTTANGAVISVEILSLLFLGAY